MNLPPNSTAGVSGMQGSTMTLWPSLALNPQGKVRAHSTCNTRILNSPTGTLLNRLFGTNFDVMDEAKRQQTTKGMLSCIG